MPCGWETQIRVPARRVMHFFLPVLHKGLVTLDATRPMNAVRIATNLWQVVLTFKMSG